MSNKNLFFAKKNNVINNEKLKEELILSIQKNIVCLDTLENLKHHYEDIYKYSKKREDEILVEQMKWIIFQINYNVDLFHKSFKKVGGRINEIKPFEWQ